MLFRVFIIITILFSIASANINWIELPYSVEINQGSYLSQDVEVTSTHPSGIKSWTTTGGRYVGLEFYGFNADQTSGYIRIIAPPVGGWFGTEAITIIPEDFDGAQNPVTIYITVKYVNTPPEIKFMSPCDEIVSDTNVTFEWNATDPDPFDELFYKVYLDGTPIYSGYEKTTDFKGLEYGNGYTWILVVNDGQNEVRDTCEFTVVENTPPDAPSISGVMKGIINQNYSINVSSTDNEDHPVQFKIDWGDGQVTDWSDFYPSASNQLFSHSWNGGGTYTITVWAKDKFEGESGSSQFQVEIIENGLYVITPFPGDILEAFGQTRIKVMVAGLNGDVNDCELYLSSNGGQNWNRIEKSTLKLARFGRLADNGIDTLEYNWTVPDGISSNQCMIKAIWIPAPENSNISGMFSIYPRRSITVTKPNGKEVISGGIINDIEWEWTGLIDKVNLYYSLNGGLRYTLIEENVDNTGAYLWSTLDTNSRYARIKIEQAGDAQLFDESDQNFQIYNNWIEIIDPVENTTYEMSKSYFIKWRQNGIIENISLKYISPEDTVQITNGTSVEEGLYKWSVPNNLKYTNQGRIVAQALNYNEITDTSANFNIIPKKQVTLLNPNGGEFIFIDSVYQINFLTTFGISTIKLEYWNNNRWNLIENDIDPLNGNYDWEIPDEEIKECYIRITADSEVSDTSNQSFSISEPLDLTITYPQADTLTAGRPDSIVWDSQGLIDYVEISFEMFEKDTAIIMNNTGKAHFNIDWYNGDFNVTIRSIGLPNGLSYSTSKSYKIKLPRPVVENPQDDSVQINAGDAVMFTSEQYGNPAITYYWNLGNDSIFQSSNTNPGYIHYYNAGKKTVHHWYKVNDFSSDTVTKIVQVDPIPDAEILEPISDTSYLKLFADMEVKGKAYDRGNVNYFWTFDKGDTLTGLNTDPISYEQPGTYEISFWYEYNTVVAKADKRTIIVNDLEPATILTPPNDTLIRIGDSLNFSGSEYEGPEANIEYEWIFSETSSSNKQNPGYVVFNEPGLFHVQYHFLVNGTESQGDIRNVDVYQPVEADLQVLDAKTAGPCENSMDMKGLLSLTGTGDIIEKVVKINETPVEDNQFDSDTTFSVPLNAGQYVMTTYVKDEYDCESWDTLDFEIIVPTDTLRVGFIYNDNYLGLDSLTVTKNDLFSIQINAAYPENFIIFMGTKEDSLKKLTETIETVYNLPLSFMVPGDYYIKVTNRHSCMSIESNLLKFKLMNETDIDESENNRHPQKLTLFQNYPNPFNPKTSIKFYLPTRDQVKLTVYNIQGQRINTIVNKSLNAGFHEYEFNAKTYPSGIYFYLLQTSKGETVKKKMMFLK